mmetsp:Transcript_19481/g.31754  ORF Transcript_19481/g.31754 Transcript_19481/m.31754 type:complete len:107 (-) Transcript_19481:1347-1667(-)
MHVFDERSAVQRDGWWNIHKSHHNFPLIDKRHLLLNINCRAVRNYSPVLAHPLELRSAPKNSVAIFFAEALSGAAIAASPNITFESSGAHASASSSLSSSSCGCFW